MKFLKKILPILIIVLYTISVYTQINFNITKEVIDDSLTLLKVEHPTNGRTAEYLVPLPADEVFFSGLYTNTNDGDETFVSGDKLETTILLPDENGGVPPIEGITNGDEIVVFGGQRIGVLNSNYERILSRKVSNYGYMSNYFYESPLFPRNKYLSNLEPTNSLLCTTLDGKLIWLDRFSYEIIHEEQISGISMVQSTMVKYDKDNDKAFWLINDWDGDTYFRIYNSDYSYSEVVLSSQINDFDFDPNTQKVYLGSNELIAYDYSLTNSYSYSLSVYGMAKRVIFSDYGIVIQPSQNEINTKMVVFNDNSSQLILTGTSNLNIETSCEIEFFKNKYLVLQSNNSIYIFDYSTGFNQWSLFPTQTSFPRKILVDSDYYYIGTAQYFGVLEKGNEVGIQASIEIINEFIAMISTNSVLTFNIQIGEVIVYNKSNLEFQERVKTADYVWKGVISKDQKRAFYITKTASDNMLYIVDIENNIVINSIPILIPLDIAPITYLEEQYVVITHPYEPSPWGSVSVYSEDGDCVNAFQLTGIGTPRDKPKMLLGGNESSGVYISGKKSIWVNVDPISSQYVYPIYSYGIEPFGEYKLQATDFARNKITGDIYTCLIGAEDYDLSILVRFKGLSLLNVKMIPNYRQESIVVDEDHNLVFLGGVSIIGENKPILGVYDGLTLNGKEFDIPVSNSQDHHSVDLSYSSYQKELYIYSAAFSKNPNENASSLFYCKPENSSSLNFSEPIKLNSNHFGFVKDKKKDKIYLGNTVGNSRFTFQNMDNLSKLWASDPVETGNYMLTKFFPKGKFGANRTPIKDLPNQAVKYFYTPNYGFSNISVIKVEKDLKKWTKNIKWISFPRMERYSYSDVPFTTQTVLERVRAFPRSLELRNQENHTATYDPSALWNYQFLPMLYSTKGYKLTLVSSGKSNLEYIEYQGGKEDPETEFYLSQGENWVGYFLEFPQKPEEAFATILDDIVYIKAQYWAMYREYPGGPFAYVGKVAPIEYGDMVEVYCNNIHPNFQWNQGGKKDPVAHKETDYYTFLEKPDYEPIFVLTGANSDIQEIAVKVNGEVKGAAVREAGDTLVQVNAYLEGVDPNAQIELETYSGGKSAVNFISDYLVLNKKSQKLEKRKVYAGEKVKFQVISINPKDEGQLPSPLGQLDVYPVPANESLNISFLMNRSSQLQLTIYNNLGQVIASPLNKSLNKGYYTYQWNLQNQEGKRVPTGIYFYRIDFPEIGISENGKIIVQ